jgi:lysophospholipase L1-like esterase
MRGLPLPILVLMVAACGRGERAREVGSDAAPAVASTTPPTVEPTPDAAPPPKKYSRVLHTGDSMVGGGLCKALQPRFEAEGAKFYRDVWESGRIFQFAASDRIPKLLKKIDPDLVILTLGSNDVWLNEPDRIASSAEKIAKMVSEGGRDCWWLAPPVWKAYFKGIVELLREHSAPCAFFDATEVEMQRRPDGIHPSDKGGEAWADAAWKALHP